MAASNAQQAMASAKDAKRASLDASTIAARAMERAKMAEMEAASAEKIAADVEVAVEMAAKTKKEGGEGEGMKTFSMLSFSVKRKSLGGMLLKRQVESPAAVAAAVKIIASGIAIMNAEETLGGHHHQQHHQILLPPPRKLPSSLRWSRRMRQGLSVSWPRGGSARQEEPSSSTPRGTLVCVSRRYLARLPKCLPDIDLSSSHHFQPKHFRALEQLVVLL